MIIGLAIGYLDKSADILCWRFRVRKSDVVHQAGDNVMIWTEKNDKRGLPDWLFFEFMSDERRNTVENERSRSSKRGGRNARINARFYALSTAGATGHYVTCKPVLCVGNAMVIRRVPNYPTKKYKDLVTNVVDGVHSVAFPE